MWCPTWSAPTGWWRSGCRRRRPLPQSGRAPRLNRAGEDAAAADPLVLTLALDAATAAWLEALRRAHFPPERNLVPAHVTLFHALPGEAIAAVRAALAEECAALPA